MLEHVEAVAVELAGRRIQRDRDVLAGPIAGGLDAGHQHRQSLLVGRQVRREAALVADRRAEAALVQRALQRVKHLGAHPQALREAGGAARHDHELLEVDFVVGVRAAVEHVHHRHRQHVRALAAEIAPQGESLLGRLRVRRRERDAEDRIGAQARLVRRPVERDQRLVETLLIGRVETTNRLRDLAVDVRDRARHALAPPCRSAVAQLGRLELTRRCA